MSLSTAICVIHHLFFLTCSDLSISFPAVNLKVMKDFHPDKTQLCITAACATASTPKAGESLINVVSKSRTLKVMRSALAGIPILTPQWMESCLKDDRMVAPSGTMCIRTLPRKRQGASAIAVDATEGFGVAKYAAAFQKATRSDSSSLLSGISVLLCGNSAGSTMTKDLRVLLQQAGATVVGSASMANRLMADAMSEDDSAVRTKSTFVFLCDDSSMNKGCGISDALFRQAKALIAVEQDSVMCVHFNWLFDSISCATPMTAEAYEPLSPRSKELWNLSVGKEVRSRTDKSQILSMHAISCPMVTMNEESIIGGL